MGAKVSLKFRELNSFYCRILTGFGSLTVRKANKKTYLFGWDHDANLLDGLGEFAGLNSAVTVQIEIFEGLHEEGFLGGVAARLLAKLLNELFFETNVKMEKLRSAPKKKYLRKDAILSVSLFNKEHLR